MDFKTATEDVPADELAAAFGVQPQTVRQYRLDPRTSGHRSPPAGWQLVVARILQSKGEHFLERASALADALDAT